MRNTKTLPLIIALALGGCVNARMDAVNVRQSNKNQIVTDTPLPTYTISSITIAGGGTGNATQFIARIFFNAGATSPGPISNSCGVASTASTVDRTCRCVYSWDEMNTTSGTVVPVTREVTTGVTNVQSQLVECAAPSVYASEIPDQTILKVRVTPSGANPSQFTVKKFNYTKNSAAVTGSFQDAEGRAFDNIFRYSCFDTMKRGLSISNRRTVVQNGNNPNETASALAATNFCLSAGGAGAENTPECTTRGAEFSAQSYYYNLYVRSTNKGSINLENQRYKCPLVKEALGGAGSVGTQNDYYPLDSNFALALTPSTDFPIGVEAQTKLGNSNDSTSGSTSCYTAPGGGGGGGAASDTGLTKSCLGFAARPAVNGSCPTFRDANNTVRPTYRLRRYIALYPPIYDTNGKLAPGAAGGATQSTDIIYVLDRPVTYPGADPLKLYTMLGPKPCPFAYYDHRAVTRPYPGAIFCAGANRTQFPECDYPNGFPSYAATNTAAWNGTNVDGIQFPRTDIEGNSCSTALPVVSADKQIWSIATVHRSNPIFPRLYVRPVEAWSPFYQEDTNYQACAPQSAPFKDPPLHFSKDPATGNVSYCAEVYPSQNTYVRELEKDPVNFLNTNLATARVANFTSHVVKNSNSAACAATQLNLTTLPTYAPTPGGIACTTATLSTLAPARHHNGYLVDLALNTAGACASGSTTDGTNCFFCSDLTCDRTVQNSNLSWTKFPLLARPDRVEQALRDDVSYQCSVTYDAGNGKTGRFTPKEGCCGGSVKVWTGIPAIGASTNVNNTSAHLEPDVACQTPAY